MKRLIMFSKGMCNLQRMSKTMNQKERCLEVDMKYMPIHHGGYPET